MSARDWFPPMYRYTSDDPETDHQLELQAVFAFNRLWSIALRNYQDGLNTRFEWPGVTVETVTEPI